MALSLGQEIPQSSNVIRNKMGLVPQLVSWGANEQCGMSKGPVHICWTTAEITSLEKVTVLFSASSTPGSNPPPENREEPIYSPTPQHRRAEGQSLGRKASMLCIKPAYTGLQSFRGACLPVGKTVLAEHGEPSTFSLLIAGHTLVEEIKNGRTESPKSK
jgi:hypothetical protein